MLPLKAMVPLLATEGWREVAFCQCPATMKQLEPSMLHSSTSRVVVERMRPGCDCAKASGTDMAIAPRKPNLERVNHPTTRVPGERFSGVSAATDDKSPPATILKCLLRFFRMEHSLLWRS